jgi:CBS-domain-containing membrane protein
VIAIMQAPVRTIGADEAAQDAWQRMRLYRVRHLVVQQGAETVGVNSAGDLGGRFGDSIRSGRTVREFMSAKIVTASLETTIREAANLMRGRQAGCLPVFSNRKLKGIVTSHDVLAAGGRGADRPVEKAERRVLKSRGEKPRQPAAAKRNARAKGQVGRDR